MKILIVEDTQYRLDWFKQKFKNHDVFYASHANDAIDYLLNHVFDLIFLDHDLSNKIFMNPADTCSGSEIVRFIIKNEIEVELIIVHSHNDPNSMRMTADLMEAGYAVCRQPFKNLANKAMREKLIKEN